MLRKQRLLRLLVLLAGADGKLQVNPLGMKAQGCSFSSIAGLWRLWPLHEGADGRAVGEHIRPEAPELQLLQQRLFPALRTSADGHVVGDHVRQEALELLLQQ